MAVGLLAASVSTAGWPDEVGFTALKARLGDNVPDGTNVGATQVEAEENNQYFPNNTDPEFAGKTLHRMNQGNGFSGHATAVGLYYYGNTTSMASGAGAIDVYSAWYWVQDSFLRTRTALAPLVEMRRVQNHSWQGSFGVDLYDTDVLRRIDAMVERDGVVIVVGVNNGAESAMPKLLPNAYNVLAVGLTSGNSSHGPAVLDAAGRVKPDMVAPAGETSWATPMVTSAATILVQAADDARALAQLPTAQQRPAKALLIKALLMVGATKEECNGWRRGLAVPCTDGTVPLDYRYGAGELNIDNSYCILAAGQHTASAAADVPLTGWDFATAQPGQSKQYFFEIPAYSYARSASILVAWNRHVATSAGTPLVLTPSLANIDLRLSRAQGFTASEPMDQSISGLDNVEHVYQGHLPAGRYVFTVTTNSTWNYAIAWNVIPTPTMGVDYDGDGDVDDAEFESLAGCFSGPSVLPSPGCDFWDLDDDDDVDQSDLGLLQTCLSGSGIPASAECLTER